MTRIQLLIKSPNFVPFELTADFCITVGELKRDISTRLPNENFEGFRLIYAGKILYDNDAQLSTVFGGHDMSQSRTLHYVPIPRVLEAVPPKSSAPSSGRSTSEIPAESKASKDSPLAITMPEELLILCFSFLDLYSLIKCSLVCKSWGKASRDEILWYSLFKKQWGDDITAIAAKRKLPHRPWRRLFCNRYSLDAHWRTARCIGMTLKEKHCGDITALMIANATPTSACGPLLCSTATDGKLRLWKISSGETWKTFHTQMYTDDSDTPTALCVSRDIAAIGTTTGNLLVYNIASSQYCGLLVPPNTHGMPCCRVNITEGNRSIMRFVDNIMDVIDTETLTQQYAVTLLPVTAATVREQVPWYATDRRAFAVTHRTVYMVDTLSAGIVLSTALPVNFRVLDIVGNPHTMQVAVCGFETANGSVNERPIVMVLDLAAAAASRKLPIVHKFAPQGQQPRRFCSMTWEGNFLVCGESKNTTHSFDEIRIFDLKPPRHLQAEAVQENGAALCSELTQITCITSDETRLFCAGSQGSIRYCGFMEALY